MFVQLIVEYESVISSE